MSMQSMDIYIEKLEDENDVLRAKLVESKEENTKLNKQIMNMSNSTERAPDNEIERYQARLKVAKAGHDLFRLLTICSVMIIITLSTILLLIR